MRFCNFQVADLTAQLKGGAVGDSTSPLDPDEEEVRHFLQIQVLMTKLLN
jgi:hypothetical protein